MDAVQFLDEVTKLVNTKTKNLLYLEVILTRIGDNIRVTTQVTVGDAKGIASKRYYVSAVVNQGSEHVLSVMERAFIQHQIQISKWEIK